MVITDIKDTLTYKFYKVMTSSKIKFEENQFILRPLGLNLIQLERLLNEDNYAYRPVNYLLSQIEEKLSEAELKLDTAVSFIEDKDSARFDKGAFVNILDTQSFDYESPESVFTMSGLTVTQVANNNTFFHKIYLHESGTKDFRVVNNISVHVKTSYPNTNPESPTKEVSVVINTEDGYSYTKPIDSIEMNSEFILLNHTEKERMEKILK